MELDNKIFGEHKKIKLTEFCSSKDYIFIHCKNANEKAKLFKEFNKLGKTWYNGTSYLDRDTYLCLLNDYTDIDCFSNKGSCECLYYVESEMFKLYEFEDVIFDEENYFMFNDTSVDADYLEENKNKDIEFTEVEKVILKNVDEKYNWIARDDDNWLWLFVEKPHKNYAGQWFVLVGDDCSIKEFDHLFECIRSTDTEPCEFKKYIK